MHPHGMSRCPRAGLTRCHHHDRARALGCARHGLLVHAREAHAGMDAPLGTSGVARVRCSRAARARSTCRAWKAS
eukprot:11108505-Alexandrium_andersonii.AAC.1